MRLQLDGDIVGTTPLKAEMLPAAILVRVPHGYAQNKHVDTHAETL